MKFAISLFLGLFVILSGVGSRASEAAFDRETAVETLRAGIEAHPDQAVVLFRDALQTTPEARGQLLETALASLELDPVLLARLLYAARLEFPEDDALFAETAVAGLPERTMDIRAAFLATPQEMAAALSTDETAAGAPLREPPAESRKLDEEIRDAIARVAAKTEGKPWPEQALSGSPVRFKKPDEIRIPRLSRYVDESGLVNHLPVDRQDEREIASGLVRIDDAWRPSGAIQLDESKFASGKESSIAPLDAAVRPMAPAGSVGLPKRPRLPRSSVYHIPSAADSYESTIDLESGETAPPALVIRPPSASPSSPR